MEHKKDREGYGFRHILAFIGGLFLFGFIYSSGVLISSQVEAQNVNELKEFYFLLAFVGLGTGYYVGESLNKKGSKLFIFLTGFYVSLFGFFVYNVYNLGFSTPLLILFMGTGLTIILHVSDLFNRP